MSLLELYCHVADFCQQSKHQWKTAMRISVSSWATTDADVDRSLEAIIRVAREVSAKANA